MKGHLVLAGGGHSHALLLRKWVMNPGSRPNTFITLVSRHSTALYSGMVPGLVAGLYQREELEIDLRQLTDQAEVALIVAEIKGLDPAKHKLWLADRPPIGYDQLSLNVGCITNNLGPIQQDTLAIKPLEQALTAIDEADANSLTAPVRILGSGLAAIEVSLALRHRWPSRTLSLQARTDSIHPPFQRGLALAGVSVQPASTPGGRTKPSLQGKKSLDLNCTGSCAPTWLKDSGLPVDERGRVRTEATLEVLGHSGHFAAGDCAVIDADPRPASGVWAVRAAGPLSRNLKASCNNRPLRPWRSQRHAMQLVGGFSINGEPTAWALWGPICLGPHALLWKWKEHIDRRFMSRLQGTHMAEENHDSQGAMLCRGCAAKFPADDLEAALEEAGFAKLGNTPEDAASIPETQSTDGDPVLQSVDGFPALISDPWLNARLTALHACSDLWACGARVRSAQAVVTLPQAAQSLQRLLLSQTLAGLRSALEAQGAELIGGHTLESRSHTEGTLSLGVQVALNVQGSAQGPIWNKRGIQAGDQLLLSGSLGMGVLFAAAMKGAVRPGELDKALAQMNRSQHRLVDLLRNLEKEHPGQLHAATDITGFGLLGHLGEMLGDAPEVTAQPQVILDAEKIPALPGALELLSAGHSSSLAPANRRAFALLHPKAQLSGHALVTLTMGQKTKNSRSSRALLDLLVDPQTCGPLLISIAPEMAKALLAQAPDEWRSIGRAFSHSRN
ncbi:selenide, water dikinase SelD [Synechococcus sp. CC9311]|uniref:selenide, water dikinase SelD n=1 Tax=Synechococcus sp. (strain CC9311) TaxID=64471 RepID=UPI00059DE971|nr:selenide, water dikinase SelD [Synechococcus sp. CC9311]